MLMSLLQKWLFPSLHGLLYAAPFGWVASMIYRDPATPYYWAGGGLVLGALVGLGLQSFWVPKGPMWKIITWGTLSVLELALGLGLLGPLIWLQVRFEPANNAHSICCETPLNYGAKQFEAIDIATADQAHIRGWYVAPSSQTGKVVILIHGSGYDRRGTDFQTKILLSAGYGVLLYDLRNHGESQGPLNSFNRMQVYRDDLQAVVTLLRAKPEVQALGVVGISLGAFTTLNATPEDLNGFAGLWLDGLRSENFGATPPLQRPLDYLRYAFYLETRFFAQALSDTPLPPPGEPFGKILPRIKTPYVMLVASGRDDSERTTNENLRPVIADKKELWIIESAWHIGGRFEVPEIYQQKLLAFFAKAFG